MNPFDLVAQLTDPLRKFYACHIFVVMNIMIISILVLIIIY